VGRTLDEAAKSLGDIGYVGGVRDVTLHSVYCLADSAGVARTNGGVPVDDLEVCLDRSVIDLVGRPCDGLVASLEHFLESGVLLQAGNRLKLVLEAVEGVGAHAGNVPDGPSSAKAFQHALTPVWCLVVFMGG